MLQEIFPSICLLIAFPFVKSWFITPNPWGWKKVGNLLRNEPSACIFATDVFCNPFAIKIMLKKLCHIFDVLAFKIIIWTIFFLVVYSTALKFRRSSLLQKPGVRFLFSCSPADFFFFLMLDD